VRTVRWIVFALALFGFLLGAEGSVEAAGTPWIVGLSAGSGGEAQALGLPAAPASATATCSRLVLGNIVVTWAAAPPAATYTVYKSTMSATTGCSVVASNVTGLTYTQSGLGLGSYWFEVSGSVGTNWTGPNSAATTPRTITLVLCS
jgi:hypothetical protein